VDNGISLAFFGFFVLMLRLENKELKWYQFVLVLSFFHATRTASFVFSLSNTSLLMDWAYWLRKVGVRSPSWVALLVLPVLFAVGYMNEKSFATQLTISIVSGLVVGDHYSHSLVAMYSTLTRMGYGDD
jgi:hypothetical protein